MGRRSFTNPLVRAIKAPERFAESLTAELDQLSCLQSTQASLRFAGIPSSYATEIRLIQFGSMKLV